MPLNASEPVNATIFTAAIIEILEKDQACVNFINSEGWTPLMYAGLHGHVEFFLKLLKCDSNAVAKNKQGKTVLMLISSYGHTHLCKISRTFSISNNSSIKVKDYVNTRDDEGRTALHYALEVNQLNCAEVLLENGADIYAEDKKKETPLSIAKSSSRKDDALKLLKCFVPPTV
uniref:Uncharacterized protein n=1 Tax=Ditylenchus dipsaci TaxID=166011 RepID=A0A915DH74_9BILA